MLRSIPASFIICLFFVACGGGSNSVHVTPVDNAPSDIKEAVEGILTAALAGDEGGFSQYLSSSCDNPGNFIAAVGALRGILPKGQLEVQLPTVQVDYRDSDHVTVRALPGLTVLVDGKALPESTELSLAGPHLELAREAGSWRLENCADLGR